MSPNLTEFVTLDQPLLVDAEGRVALLEKGVKPI
jgi:hypothetical protein|tara:strand:- start:479 stop:580 length:102 start_codon:yes stop_codon:yes gene_type:complete